MDYPPIENHGLIGDLHTAALVSLDGSIDFLCHPRFDSSSIFAALLDRDRGGRFGLHPRLEDAQPRQSYLPDTNVPFTRFLSADGVGEISDFMPIDVSGTGHQIIRRAMAVRGEMRFEMQFQPRFDYGRSKHQVEAGTYEAVFISQGWDASLIRLRSQVPLRITDDGEATAAFTLAAGETAAFSLEPAESGGSGAPDSAQIAEAFKQTVNY